MPALSEYENKPHIVYWIRYPEHTDPYSEGYIGITCTPLEARIRGHKRHYSARLAPLFEERSDIEWSTLHECKNKAEAEALEYKYRPRMGIAWNARTGGNQKTTVGYNGGLDNCLFNIKVPRSLKDDFIRLAKENGSSGSRIVKDLMEAYVRENS